MTIIKELCHCKKNFDAWSYNILWPQDSHYLPLLLPVKVTVEDIKFAYNAWSLLRLCLFYGVGYPHILSDLTKTTPSVINPVNKGQYSLERYVVLNSTVSPHTTKIGLHPSHLKSIAMHSVNWSTFFRQKDFADESPCFSGSQNFSKMNTIELVLGMENGMSSSVAEQCDILTFIPQDGSIGSLSMMSALAIALHQSAHAWNNFQETINPNHEEQFRIGNGMQSIILPSSPRNPFMLNNNGELAHLSNEDIKRILQIHRSLYKLQLSVLIYNEMADRNIGAIIRNGNAFNCEKVLVVHRRRFNKRGTLGTDHITDLLFFPNTTSPAFQQEVHGYEIWMVHQYYPYTHIHGLYKENGLDEFPSSIDPQNKDFLRWCTVNDNLPALHPLHEHFPHLSGTAVFLDDDASVSDAVKLTFTKGYKGIMLAVPEDGATPHPNLAGLAHREVFLRRPKNVPWSIQRGLNGALSSAVVLERLRREVHNLK